MAIDYREALDIVIGGTPPPHREEHVPLGASFGRCLSRDVAADADLPPFDKATMDGFAVRASDVARAPAALCVVMEVRAGSRPEGRIGAGQAATVMTGAPLPDGADAVVPVEQTSGFGAPEVVVRSGVAAGINVSSRGEILSAGSAALWAGTCVCVEEASLLAALGQDPVWVHALPRVAVLTTGDEVVPPSDDPGPAQIRDSNGPALAAFLCRMGCAPVILGHVGDDPEATRRAVARGLEQDCLIVTGGVSVGTYDFVRDVLRELDVSVAFDKVLIKPGRPTVFGTRGRTIVFGLPGNPVSAIAVCRALVEPALRKLAGRAQIGPRTVRARLLGDIRKKPDRLWLVHGALSLDEEVAVEPIASKGSADLPAAVRGDCLILAPKGASLVEQGSFVDVIVWERCL